MVKRLKNRFESYLYQRFRDFQHREQQIKLENRLSYFLRQAEFDYNKVKIEDTANLRNNSKVKSNIAIGAGSWLKGELMTFAHGGRIIIGKNCHIGEGTKIWSAKSIEIGNNVLIAHNVNIHDNISHPLDSKSRREDYQHIYTIGLQEKIDLREKEVVIEDDVWIGFNCTILKGVRIGRGAIIGSNSIITKDIDAFTCVAGNPPRVIKQTI